MVNKSGRPGLKDVALLAGVSPKTVSNVLGGYANVTPKTTEKVRKAAETLGYMPNLGARLLRNGKSGLIGLAVPNLRIPYFADLADLVIQAAEHNQWTVLIDQTNGVVIREHEVVKGIRPHIIDGLIFSPSRLSGVEVAKLKTDIPIVLIGENGLQDKFDYVSIDNIQAAKDATNHLVKILKRKQVAVIGQDIEPKRFTGKIRTQGYLEALQENGIKADNRLIIPVADFTYQHGYDAAKRLLKSKVPFDGLFCFNDPLAVGAIKALNENEIKIPEEVAVVGFDDSDEARFTSPSITSISPDKDALAQAAIEMLKSRIDSSHNGPVKKRTVAHTLVYRESAPRIFPSK